MQLEIYLALKEKVIGVGKSALVQLEFNMRLFSCKKSTLKRSFLNQKAEYDKLLLEADPFRMFHEHKVPKNKMEDSVFRRLASSECSCGQV